jgi:hypothetical protein
MALRIAGGPFRLWLLLSVLWIITVLTVIYFRQVELTDTDLGLPPGTSDDLIIESRCWSGIKTALWLAPVPPVLLLAIGWAVARVESIYHYELRGAFSGCG